MQRRLFITILAFSILILGIIGALSWYQRQEPSAIAATDRPTHPAGTIFVPRQTPFMASLLVNPDRLEGLPEMEALLGRQAKAFHQLKQTFLANTGLDYETEIRPWLNHEVTLAITNFDLDRDPENGQQLGYLLIMSSRNPDLARSVLQRFWERQAQSGWDLVIEPYQGVQITSSSANKGGVKATSQAAAVVGDFVLFANHPKVLKTAINAIQVPELALENAQLYQQAIQNLSSDSLGILYSNLSTVWSQPGTPLTSTVGLTPASSDVSLAIGITANSKGLLADTVLLPTEALTQPAGVAGSTSPVTDTLGYLPANALVAISGQDFGAFWHQIQRWLAPESGVADLLKQVVSRLPEKWDVDFSDEVISGLKGSYALGLVPRGTQNQWDWVFVIQRSEETEATIAQLDQQAQAQGFSVEPLALGDHEITAWTRIRTTATDTPTLNTQVQGFHRDQAGYEIVASSIESMGMTLQPAAGSLLAQSDVAQAIQALAQPHSGYLYLDWPTAQTILAQQWSAFRWIELAARPLFQHLQFITLGLENREGEASRSQVFLDLTAD